MNRLLVACGAIVAIATAAPAPAQPSEAAGVLANRLTGTELIVSIPFGEELGRGGVVSTAIDTCRLDLMWTGGADMSVDLGAIGLLDWNDADAFSFMETGDGRPYVRFVVGPDRYEAALEAFNDLARACGSDPQRPVRIVMAPQG